MGLAVTFHSLCLFRTAGDGHGWGELGRSGDSMTGLHSMIAQIICE